MTIEKVILTKENLMDVCKDSRVYVINESMSGEFRMRPISETNVSVILSGNNEIVRITKTN